MQPYRECELYKSSLKVILGELYINNCHTNSYRYYFYDISLMSCYFSLINQLRTPANQTCISNPLAIFSIFKKRLQRYLAPVFLITIIFNKSVYVFLIEFQVPPGDRFPTIESVNCIGTLTSQLFSQGFVVYDFYHSIGEFYAVRWIH